ncbi:hypothetical protein WME97_12870 [Sorangium sp. So ce367]|uniref:hypothetical protein n=1 Tax=Sorangium sp. So ce367 TaxID=3133305 RepID=UPI003F5D9C99
MPSSTRWTLQLPYLLRAHGPGRRRTQDRQATSSLAALRMKTSTVPSSPASAVRAPNGPVAAP